jgi:electron transport complex protein RnfD
MAETAGQSRQPASAPHLQPPVSVPVMMRRVLYALTPALGAYVWFFGPGILLNIGVAVSAAGVTEAACLRLQRRDLAPAAGDYSAVVTGVLLAFALPPLTPWWITALGSAFAIGIAKHAYGGIGSNPFNPAMAGYVALLVAFPDQLTNWLPPRMGDIDYQPISWLANLRFTLTGVVPGLRRAGVGMDRQLHGAGRLLAPVPGRDPLAYPGGRPRGPAAHGRRVLSH